MQYLHRLADAPPPPTDGRHGRPIVVLRRGGLGNQLFQYAAAIQASRATGGTVSYTPSDEILRRQDPQLEDLVGPLPAATASQLAPFLWPPPGIPIRAVKWIRRIRWTLGIGRPVWRLVDGYMEQVERPLWGDSLLYDSMFQIPSCFGGGIADAVARILDRRPGWAVPREDVVAVNFRTATDFRRLGWVLPFSYYEAALAALDPRRESTLWPVGDEVTSLDEASSRLRARGWRVERPDSPQQTKGLADFWDLARARGLVMSTSTFTWWAAVVGDGLWGPVGRRVACPSPWRPVRKTYLIRDRWLPIDSLEHTIPGECP